MVITEFQSILFSISCLIISRKRVLYLDGNNMKAEQDLKNNLSTENYSVDSP